MQPVNLSAVLIISVSILLSACDFMPSSSQKSSERPKIEPLPTQYVSSDLPDTTSPDIQQPDRTMMPLNEVEKTSGEVTVRIRTFVGPPILDITPRGDFITEFKRGDNAWQRLHFYYGEEGLASTEQIVVFDEGEIGVWTARNYFVTLDSGNSWSRWSHQDVLGRAMMPILESTEDFLEEGKMVIKMREVGQDSTGDSTPKFVRRHIFTTPDKGVTWSHQIEELE